MKTVYFYTLKCPITNDVKYVGRSVNPDGRYRQHIHSGKCEGHKDRKGAWIKSLLDKDLKPIMEIIDKLENYIDIEEVKRREESLILEFRKTCDLKNDRDIVDNGYNFSKESRQKMSDAQKGKKKINKDGIETSVDPFELKDFLENGWQLGRIYKPSKEILEKIGTELLGRKKINNSVSEKYVKESELQSFLETGWVLGRLPLSSEHKEKLKEAWKNRKEVFGNSGQPDEYIPHNKGKKLSKNNNDKREYR